MSVLSRDDSNLAVLENVAAMIDEIGSNGRDCHDEEEMFGWVK